MKLALGTAGPAQPTADGARNAASVLARVNCSVLCPWASDGRLSNCAALQQAWQQENEQARANPKTILADGTYQRMAVAALQPVPRPARSPSAERNVRCSSRSAGSVSSAANRPASRPRTAVSPCEGTRGGGPRSGEVWERRKRGEGRKR